MTSLNLKSQHIDLKEDSVDIDTYFITQQDLIYPVLRVFKLGYNANDINKAMDNGSLRRINGNEDLLQEDGWLWVTETKNGGDFFIKTKVISKSNNDIKIWVMTKGVSITIKKIKKLNCTTKDLVSYNCSESKYTIISHVTYDSKGNIIQNVSDLLQKEQYVIPESAMERLLNNVCKLFN